MSPKNRNEFEGYNRNVGFEYRATFTATNNVEYEGWAYPTGRATDEGALVWQIVKHSYDTSGNLTKSSWADYTDAFIKSWTLKGNYNYA